MRLMLLIIAMVLGSFILFNAFTRKKQKKHETIHDEFEQTILENSQSHVAQAKRVEQMQHEHQINKAYEPGKTNPFAIAEDDDPLLQDLNQPMPIEYSQTQQVLLDSDKYEDIIEDEIQERPRTHEFIALTVIPKHSAQFSGVSLQAILSRNHFRYGRQKLYHRHYQDNPSQSILYSVASLAKPGYFEQAGMTQQTFVGILIYMLLDDVDDPVATFEKMLTSARQLSAGLQAELCDAKRMPITTTSIQEFRAVAKSAVRSHIVRDKEFQEW